MKKNEKLDKNLKTLLHLGAIMATFTLLCAFYTVGQISYYDKIDWEYVHEELFPILHYYDWNVNQPPIT